MELPEKANERLNDRRQNNSFRSLAQRSDLTDFSTNDYLGFATSETIFEDAHTMLLDCNNKHNGATGSRLISGNHRLYELSEKEIAGVHNSDSALLFNSGYDANVGIFSSLPQRNDIILYDEYCHASIRDGIRMSNAKAFKFGHNDLAELEQLIVRHQSTSGDIYIATESVFSMDGDSPDLIELVSLSENYRCFTIVDEAHALGVFGVKGEGLVQHLNLENRVLARVMTFGKGLGCHGAAVLGSTQLSDYLVNFARSFIYTTGLPPHSVATIRSAYKHLKNAREPLKSLRDNILHFNQEMNRLNLKPLFVKGKSAVKSAIIPGNDNVKRLASRLQEAGFDVRPILSPTVPEGQERLRICLHSYNSAAEISSLLEVLAVNLT